MWLCVGFVANKKLDYKFIQNINGGKIWGSEKCHFLVHGLKHTFSIIIGFS